MSSYGYMYGDFGGDNRNVQPEMRYWLKKGEAERLGRTVKDCLSDYTVVYDPSKTASSSQVGGDHYKKYPIQPIEYAHKNNLGPLEHGVVKYVTRHQDKGGAEDIRKAIHYLELILEFKYPNA